MKNKAQKLLKRALLAGLLPMTLLASCIKDNTDQAPNCGKGATVTFSVKLPGKSSPDTRSLTDPDENRVSEINVLLFEKDGSDGSGHNGKFVGSYRCTSINGNDGATKEATNTKSFSVLLPQGDYDVVVLANATADISAAGLNGKYMKAALKDLTRDISANAGKKWLANSSQTIPMFGSAGVITIVEGMATQNLSLTRMIARVDVVVALSDQNAPSFELTSVYVYNVNTRGSVVPDYLNASAWGNYASDAPTVGAHALLPTLPAVTGGMQGPLAYTGSEVTSAKCAQEIYIFETENHKDGAHTDANKKELTDRTCLVIGARFDGGAETFYRLDFSKGSGAAQTGYLDILRNHQYIFSITKVGSAGFGTKEEAFNSPPANITCEVIDWNNGEVGTIIIGDQNMLTYTPSSFLLARPAITAKGTDNLLKIYTDAAGWKIESITYKDTGAPAAWLEVWNEGVKIQPNYLVPFTEAEKLARQPKTYWLKLDENFTGVERTAVIAISAARLRFTVEVTQECSYQILAYNILVFDGESGKLRVSGENEDIRSLKNIPYFKFGSVVGVVGSATWDNVNSIRFNPTSTASYAYADVPLFATTDWKGSAAATPSISDPAYHNGANIRNGKGDPCKLAGFDLNSPTFAAMDETQKAAALAAHDSGWRLPTNAENVAFVGGKNPNAALPWNGTSFSYANAKGAADPTFAKADYWEANGSYMYNAVNPSVGWFPVTHDGTLNKAATGGTALPAAGSINPADGSSAVQGLAGYYWSGKASSGTAGYLLFFGETGAYPLYNFYTNKNGFPVRCVPTIPNTFTFKGYYVGGVLQNFNGNDAIPFSTALPTTITARVSTNSAWTMSADVGLEQTVSSPGPAGRTPVDEYLSITYPPHADPWKYSPNTRITTIGCDGVPHEIVFIPIAYELYSATSTAASTLSGQAQDIPVRLIGYFPDVKVRFVVKGGANDGTVVSNEVTVPAVGSIYDGLAISPSVNVPLTQNGTYGSADRDIVLQYLKGSTWTSTSLTFTQSGIPLWGGYDDILVFDTDGTLRIGAWARDWNDAAYADGKLRGGDGKVQVDATNYFTTMAFFKFGSVVGFTPDGSTWNTNYVKFNPHATIADNGYGTGSAGWGTVPSYTVDDYQYVDGTTKANLRNFLTDTYQTGAMIGQKYHNATNIRAGKGDPCKLVGKTGAQIRAMSDAELAAYDSGWRLPTNTENGCFADNTKAATLSSYSDGTYNYWTANGVNKANPGTAGFPVVAATKSMILPAAGYRTNTYGSVDFQGYGGYYWSGTAYNSSNGYFLYFFSNYVYPVYTLSYAVGLAVRCVRDDQRP